MNEREQIEQQIRDVVAKEIHAIPLSNKLFTPDGLFSRLASTEEERRIVSQSSLFRQALKRLSELQQKEAAEFGRVVQQAQAGLPDGNYRFTFEPTKKS
jgi:hypothetical protein